MSTSASSTKLVSSNNGKSATSEMKVPIYKKYAKSLPQNWLDPSNKLKPSDFSKPSIDIFADDYPMIIEFNNMQDNTSQLHSTVDIDQPLFQPSPKIVVFDDYQPFTPVERKIFFRNNDSVARRVKVFKPDSPFFDVSAPKTLTGEALQQSKIASGMEVCFILTFKPQEVRDYSWDLVCSTEREKFIVPIRAIGMRPRLTFPDEIEFGSCPIKAPTKKKLLVQNIGSSAARFTMKSSNKEFECPEQEMSIESGASQSIELFFTPHSTELSVAEIEIDFKSIKCYIALRGEGKNVEVSLSTPSVTLEPSYISLLSQKTIKIRNLSDAPISYMWKSFSNIAEEEAERERLMVEIDRMEEIERNNLKQRILDGYYGHSDENEMDYNTGNEEGMFNQSIPMAAKADDSALVRKYRNLRRALEKDSMQFVDDIFEITPTEGQVWAHSEMEITVCFRPDTAAQYNCVAYLDISGRSDRLSLQVTGQGIGPHASLSKDIIDIGDIFVNEEHSYELSIKNKGDIPAQWTFMSSLTRFGNKFRFSPTEGFLQPNQKQTISIKFESDILGEFAEYFRFALQGNEDMLVCQIKGQVVGPTFHFDCNSIDFGTVSFDYLHSTTLKLVNTSTIPMVYNLHIPQDGTYLKKEFNIEPTRGTLSPKESTEVLIEFIPSTVKVFDYTLAVDVLGVGDSILSIPILAECIVSTISLESKEIDFGDCFIRYPYEKEFRLTNMSNVVHTKFEISPQPRQTKSVGLYETEPSVAVIEPGDSMNIKIKLTAMQLGPFKVPLTFNIAGSREPPIQAVIQFNTVGPKVSVGAPELKWGNIECLKDSVRTLTIINEGLIVAPMKIFLKMARSVYSIGVRDLILEPQSSYDVPITANLDDSIVNKDEAHIVVDEGDNLMVPLIAKGIGTTIYCKHDVNVIDFGVQLTNTVFEKQIVLENKGRRPQQLKWQNKTVFDENEIRFKKAKKLKDQGGPTARIPKSLLPIQAIFTVTPEEITLRPRTATTFTFKGTSPIPKEASELFILESKVGKDKYMKKIIETEVKSVIVNPLLVFSTDIVKFEYIWVKNVEALIQKYEITLTNNSATDLSFFLKTEIPFNLNSWEHTLEPQQSVDIVIEFDPTYRDDKVSHIVEKALVVNYRGHPQKDSIPLRGDIVFPNLKFDTESVNFGCVLNDTMKVMKVKVTNSCRINVNYEWIFLDSSATEPKKKGRGAAAQVLPANQVFDILPVNSMLIPSASEDVEFSMFGNANSKFSGSVICIVDGGPEYKFPISGEASTVSFSLNRSIIDFAKVVISEKADEELIITNNGKVAFNYSIEPYNSSGAELFEIIPSSGKVPGGQSFKVIVRIKPGLPVMLAEPLEIRIAHFDPVKVTCYCQGIFPSAVILLPRQKKIGPFGQTDGDISKMWENFEKTVLKSICYPNAKLLPPPVVPDPASGTTALSPQYFPVEENPNDFKDIDEVTVTSTKGIPQLSIEVEMQRQVLCYHLSNRIGELSAKITDDSTKNGLQDYIAKYIDLKDIVAANYLCDFGNVIMGQTRKKIFRITNASLVGQLNWVFDPKYLSGSGFSIEPQKVSKLAESTTVDMEVKYFARFNQKTGPKTKILPLENDGSPTMNIIFSANACLPEVILSSYFVDFGKVLIGRSTKTYIRLHNPTPVRVNWQFKTVAGKEENKFIFEPSAGSLRPGRKMIVCIEFLPADARRYSTELMVKVENNRKAESFKIIGEGLGTPLKFEPNILEMGPVVPYTDGDYKVVTVTNHSDIAVEFYSLDFDTKYKEEENVLTVINSYDEYGVFRTEPRLAGQDLPPEIMEEYQKLIPQENNNAELDPSEEVKDNEENKSDFVDKLIVAPIRESEGPRDSDLQQDIIVIGPPLSGVSTYCKMLSKKLQLTFKTFDELIEDVAKTDDPLGLKARMLLNTLTAEEVSKLKAQEEELVAAAEQSKTDAAEAYKKEKKGKVKEIPDEVYNTPQVAELNEFLASKDFSITSLVNVIQFRLKWIDVGFGLILDNILSKYFTETIVMETIRTALPKLFFTVINISKEEEGYAAWLAYIYGLKNEEVNRMKVSMDAIKKLILKLYKPPRGQPSQIEELEASISAADFECIPTGDESWVNADSGLVIELDGQEIKALEDIEKTLYYKQLLSQQKQQCSLLETDIQRVLTLWTPETGIISPPSLESSEEKNDVDSTVVETVNNSNKVFYYADYGSKVMSLLNSVKEDLAKSEDETDSKAPVEPSENDVENASVSEKENVAKINYYLDINVEGDETEDAVFSIFVALLPAPLVPPPDKDAIPDSKIYQIFRKPISRPNKKIIRNYEILPYIEENTEEAAPNTEISSTINSTPYRWKIEPNESVKFRILFKANSEGKFESPLDFEIVNNLQKYTLFCKGICEFPRINEDTRSIFMRRTKVINPSTPLPQKRYVIGNKFFSFGPLSLFKKPTWKKELKEDSSEEDKSCHQQIESTNMDTIRLTNCGKYKCEVELAFDNKDEGSKGVFEVEQKKVEIEEGETKEVKVWALPTSIREFSNNLLICVKDNPTPLLFHMKCWGVEPTIGPWGDALEKAEQAVAQCTDKKLVKDLEAKLASLKEALTLDFDRILINKTDTRSFTIKNTCLLPVAWEIDYGDFKDSPNISIEPSSGILPIGTTLPIVISFTSPDPLMLTGKFSLKYSDHEGGLESSTRVITKTFRAVAEAYKIIAVSLTAAGQEEGGSEIDYGLIRVGDYAIQTMKMGNKGKYKIGYSFKLTTPAIQNLVKIEPMQGEIETGNSLAEIKVTFCSKAGELLLKNNKEVMIEISEPLTGEIVEKFPLYISANVKYNRFRLQPSKGMQFGAIRFDSEPRVKRVELKNEGNFELTYVICAAISEHDELDTLDAGALSCYAFATPAALRSNELGEDYIKRLGPGDAGGKGGKAPPPAKGKGGKGGAAVEAVSSVLNPLVQDPDALPPGTLPVDPLVVGAFSITPRVAIIQPGQSVGIDMKFDPSGCATVKERLRLCISGVDPSDTLSQVIKSFEITGESCVPALVTDDVNSIFEEQEIVNSLADSTGDKASEGGGKIEKLAVGKVVYAESEKMLAFGPVSCGTAGRGVVERIKISNPTKIDIKVKCKIYTVEEAEELKNSQNRPKSAAAKGKDAGKGKPPAKGAAPVETAPVPKVFTVQPERWEIPPHEHRFISIYFNPTEIKSYRYVFIADIDDEGVETSAAPKTNTGKSLTFDLGGTGTLPCIGIDSPTERDAEGKLLVNFGTVLVDRSMKKKIIIRNDGVMPATCLFDFNGDKSFSFPSHGSSLTISPGKKEELPVSFIPKQVIGDGNVDGMIKISVLNNQYDQYFIKLKGTAYSCDAVIDTIIDDLDNPDEATKEGRSQNEFTFPEINLADGPGSSSHTIMVKSKSNKPLKFQMVLPEGTPKLFSFSPSMGHLGPNGTREVKITFSASEPIKLDSSIINCTLKQIEYVENSEIDESSLYGKWDDAMKSYRLAMPEDLEKIAAAEKAMKDYEALVEAENKKGKKAKPVGPPPEKCLLELAPLTEDGVQNLYEIVAEPKNNLVADASTQSLSVNCNCVADIAKYTCEGNGENISFKPTFLFQSTIHKFLFKNDSNILLPIKWTFDNMKNRGSTRNTSRIGSRPKTEANSSALTQSPFSICEEECEIIGKSEKQFTLKFLPLDAEDFFYLLKGETLSIADNSDQNNNGGTLGGDTSGSTIRMVLRGSGKRPICHFDIQETLDYMSRRPSNMKNENGQNSPIEAMDIRIAELESTGLQSRNTFRFYITNPTGENYEFLWEAMGDPSPFWRCVQSAGMMFAGKRIEMVFEYLPDEINVAESFFKFRIPKKNLEQIFLFTGKVIEPKVFFSTSKIDYHSVMLGGEGSSETIYMENKDHIPFNFSFERQSLEQLEGPNGPVLQINPKSGTVPPHGKIPISFMFKPQEEVIYNFNIHCDVKRKPNKLSINVKGEGYAVHPFIQIEQPDDISGGATGGTKYITLRPSPTTNFADFGAVQILDTIAKTLSITNNGKFNFDYVWDIESISSMLTLSGGKMGGTLLKGETIEYKLTFAPQTEERLDGSMLSLTIAGKYVYNILARGMGVKPALRFNFMNYNFGPCFITSPGGATVIEETTLRITNHDPSNNISIECELPKTRTLWVDCPPSVITPGSMLEVPIKFAPREVKDTPFVFNVPFIVNGTSRVPVTISGSGITARLELVNGSQRKTNFGLVNVGNDSTRSVAIVNRSKKALPVQLLENGGEYGGGSLTDRCISFAPKSEFILGPRESVPIQLIFNPTKRIAQFNEDLMIRYAGVTRKLLNLTGKSQGIEVSLDSDSLPFGVVVIDSQKIRKLVLENTGDIPITFSWMESSFGKHFSITPLTGKLLPANEISFDVIFKPVSIDEDIRQDGITLMIPGNDPLRVTCTGGCIAQPSDTIQTLQFNSLARKSEVKSVKIQNPSDRDWYLSPSLQGDDWKIPHEFKVPAKGAADLNITYFPLSMAKGGEGEKTHTGQIFVPLPDGSAQLYKLTGIAGAPECSGQLSVETPAKKAANVIIKVNNWLNENQRMNVTVDLKEKASPATFIIAANATEIGPNGTKEFPIRFVSFTEGTSKGTITFTNPVTGEYSYFELTTKTTMPEVLETINIESPVRQTARYIITVENPLPQDTLINMGSIAKPTEWWTCDSKVIKVNELMSLSGNAEGTFEVEYRPLAPTAQPTEHLLTLITRELGTFKYKVVLKSTPPLLRQILRFNVPLGSIQTEQFVFRAFNTTKCDYTCTAKKPDYFTVQKTLTVDPVVGGWDGDDVKLNVVFEPADIGEIRDVLTVSSPEGGEYVCELVGSCIAAMPQGPFNLVQGGGAVDIPFRNCFSATSNWQFSTDSNAFRIATPSASVNAKSDGKVSVFFEPKEEHLSTPGGFINAKLFITCAAKPNLPPWVFYLKGKIDLNAPAVPAGKGKK